MGLAFRLGDHTVKELQLMLAEYMAATSLADSNRAFIG